MNDLDRPILQYDSSLSFSDTVAAREVTLRQLLSHTSGLDDTDKAEPKPLQCIEHLSFVARPTQAFRYSNVGFDVGVLSAARRSGVSYEELLRTRVLAPLVMKNTDCALVSHLPHRLQRLAISCFSPRSILAAIASCAHGF